MGLAAISPVAASAETQVQPPGNPKPKVIPALQNWTGGNGTFTLGQESRIIAGAGTEAVGDQFRQDLLTSSGLQFPIAGGAVAPGDISLVLDPTLGSAEGGQRFAEEGYLLTVDADSATIKAPSVKGLFYGTRTILQILMQAPDRLSLPVGNSTDWPNYAERGFMLDVGRRFFSPQFVRDYITMMSWYKLNTFQIHLNDNEIAPANGDFTKAYSGFRLASTNPSLAGLASSDGAYTRSDWDSFEDLAASRAMKIVPELGGPGHDGAIIKWKPSIGLNNGNSDHLDLSNPEATQTMKELYQEFVPWFRSPNVHIGTDEYPRKFAAEYKIYFNEIARYVRELGKQPLAWGSATVMQGNADGYDRNVTITSWNDGWYSMKNALADGFKFINTRDADLYVVPFANYYHGNGLNNPGLYANWLPNTDGSGNELVPAGTPEGAMFAVWNDLVNEKYTEQDVHRLIKDSFAVIAQKTWRAAVPELSYAQFARASSMIGSGPGLTTINPKSPISGELGFGAEVTASSADAQAAASNLTDGFNLSKWSTSESSATLTVDLGESKTVGSLQVDWTTRAAAAYDIEVSRDGVFWQRLGRHENTAGAGNDDSEIGGFTTRYLRLANIVSARSNGLAAWRLSVFPPADLARGAKVTASGTESGTNFTPDLAVDGSSSTRWSADYSANPWIQVDLGTAQLVNAIRLNWENASASAYVVEGSVDGSAWTPIVTKTNAPLGARDDVESFNPALARYLKVRVTAKSIAPYLSLFDFEVRSAARPPIVLDGALDPAVPTSGPTYTSAPKLALSADTSLPGDQAIELSVNGGDFLPYTSPISLNGSGEVPIAYRARIGDRTASGYATIPIDTVLPGQFGISVPDQELSAFRPATDFQIKITGANPGSIISAELHSDPVMLGTARAAADGTAVIQARLPGATAVGAHELVVTGTDTSFTSQTRRLQLTVRADPTSVTLPTTEPEAETQRDAEPLAQTGTAGIAATFTLILLLTTAGGSLLLVASRAKRRGNR